MPNPVKIGQPITLSLQLACDLASHDKIGKINDR